MAKKWKEEGRSKMADQNSQGGKSDPKSSPPTQGDAVKPPATSTSSDPRTTAEPRHVDFAEEKPAKSERTDK